MRRIYTIFALLMLVMLHASCSKKGNVNPSKNNSTSLNTATVTQIPVVDSFIPFTDTFYGMVYESDFTTPTTADSVREIHIYAYYSSGREVRFSSDDYSCKWGFGIRFNGDFITCDSNYYSKVFEKYTNFYNFRIRKDSLFYNYSAEVGCPDIDRIYFAGKRINKRITRER